MVVSGIRYSMCCLAGMFFYRGNNELSEMDTFDVFFMQRGER